MTKSAPSAPVATRGDRARGRGPASFVLGRAAFAKVSAVEGIVASESLDDDLRQLAGASPDRRRQVLAGKYAKP